MGKVEKTCAVSPYRDGRREKRATSVGRLALLIFVGLAAISFIKGVSDESPGVPDARAVRLPCWITSRAYAWLSRLDLGRELAHWSCWLL
jgi:hypothetical protein